MASYTTTTHTHTSLLIDHTPDVSAPRQLGFQLQLLYFELGDLESKDRLLQLSLQFRSSVEGHVIRAGDRRD